MFNAREQLQPNTYLTDASERNVDTLNSIPYATARLIFCTCLLVIEHLSLSHDTLMNSNWQRHYHLPPSMQESL